MYLCYPPPKKEKKKKRRQCRVCKKIEKIGFGLVLIRDFRLFVVWKTNARKWPTKLNWAVTQNMTEDCLFARKPPSRRLSSWNLNIFITRTGNCLHLCGLFSCPSEWIYSVWSFRWLWIFFLPFWQFFLKIWRALWSPGNSHFHTNTFCVW